MLAEGVRIRGISRVKGFKEDTILGWLREAAEHAKEVEAVLLHDYEVSKAQIDYHKPIGTLWEAGSTVAINLVEYRQLAMPALKNSRWRAGPVGSYLREVVKEASRRGYHFDDAKIVREGMLRKLPVTVSQIAYEWSHLQARLKTRSLSLYERNLGTGFPDAHPIFEVIPGDVENWERR